MEMGSLTIMKEPFLSSSWHRVAKLKPRLRGHAQVRRHHYRGQPWYIIKNEVSGRFHRFTPAVYLFLGLMNGERNVDQLWSAVVTRLGDDAPTQDQIIGLLSQLHAADLLQSNVSPDAEELFERYASYSRMKVRQSFGSLLFVKIPVVDPDRFLERTAATVRPFFEFFGAVLWLAIVLPGLILAAIHWPDLTGDITDQILSTQNLLMAAVVFTVLKTLHELGHGYATKVSGGTVHEMGIMLLVFAPVPYVDASASAAFPNKWRRILVGASGMLVELFLASLALYLWLLMEPGTMRAVCYNMMLVAGVSTIIFNLNPLLRFDGYYMLCDFIEIPNLSSRATRYWSWLVDRRIFGADVERPNATFGEQAWFIVYAPLAFAYRSLVILGIALFLATQYYVVGGAIALWAIFSVLIWPFLKGLSHVFTNSRLEQKRMRAASLALGGGGALAACLLTIPVPFHTVAEGIIWLPEANIVRSTADGFVKALAVPSGLHVEPGTVLVRTEDPDVTSQIRILRSQVDAANVRLASERFHDRVQARITQQELGVFKASLADAEKKAAELLVCSPAAGVFVVPRAGDLPGRFIRRGDVIGYIKDPNAHLVRVVVTQSNIGLVRTRLTGIEVRLPQYPGETRWARVLREVPAGSAELPSKALTREGGGSFSTDPHYPDQVRSAERTFQFDLELPPGAAPGYFGSRVQVRFAHEAEPLGLQWYRRLRQLFLARFDA
jgi:putative peptide zinc metalloprotease protein